MKRFKEQTGQITINYQLFLYYESIVKFKMASVGIYRIFVSFSFVAIIVANSQHDQKYLDAAEIKDILHQQKTSSVSRKSAEDQWVEGGRANGPAGGKNIFHLLSDVTFAKQEVVREVMKPLFARMEEEDALDDVIRDLVRAQVEPEPDRLLCTACTVII